jgi:hypothetical protein
MESFTQDKLISWPIFFFLYLYIYAFLKHFKYGIYLN